MHAVGHNETNRTMNPTRHAEFVAIESLQKPGAMAQVLRSTESVHPKFADVDLKCRDINIDHKSFFNACDLFVTVEPCIMYVAQLCMPRVVCIAGTVATASRANCC